VPTQMHRPTNLYTSLLSKSGVDTTSPLTEKEIEVLRSVSLLQESQALAIKELILYHTHNNSTNTSEETIIPYGGVQLSYGTEFDALKLPLELARVIVKFVEMTKRNV
jgi:hypothetical protein